MALAHNLKTNLAEWYNQLEICKIHSLKQVYKRRQESILLIHLTG